jgi:DNA-directed RNA polymerase II subunit RPB1
MAQTLKPGWIVERHLRNGDWVVFNRQPSLHKASIMAFQAYETTSYQFKLPLPCTKPFNADFDGDEMNLHALQSYLAIAEAQEIMSVPHQMVTPQSNSVIIALVQDSIVAIFKMTRQDAFCTFEEAVQLAMCIHYATDTPEYTELPHGKQYFLDYASIPSPAILFPKPLWTGKQILSWILPHTYNFTKAGSPMSEDTIVIRHGQLLCGRLCKQTMGTSSNGIVHAIWKQFSPWAASKFVSDAQRMLMQWLRVDSICISIRDCLSMAEEKVDELCAKAMGQADAIESSDVPREIREVRQTQILQEALRSVGAEVLSKMNMNGGIATVVASGSKGNLMNIAQIAGLVGQQTINGSRIAFRSGPKGPRTLACFAPSDNSPEARGFVASSYLQGLQPSEFFFHQQAGREGVVATAVSTADTGYNQRRMVKNQESEVISYDLSVRVSSNLIVQQHYGGDDYDGTRVERVKLPFLAFEPREDVSMKKLFTLAFTTLKAIKNSTAMYGAELSAEVSMPCNLEKVIASVQMCSSNGLPCNKQRLLHSLLRSMVRAHDTPFDEKDCLEDLIIMKNLNRITHDDPGLQARLCVTLQCCLCLDTVYEHEEEDILRVFTRQYTMGIVNPGEGVGAVGSSCIGEPSTQMTLNIFHYSGIAEKNVTLTGLPRFKQIINAVDTSETSNMRIKMKIAHEGDAAKFYARSFSSRLVKTLLGDIVKKSRVILADDGSMEAQLEKLSCDSLGFDASPFVIIYYIDKNASYTRYLNIEEVGSSLSSFMGESAQVTWSARWCKEWIVRVRPSRHEQEGFEHTVTEALQDSILENACINGIDGIRKAVPMGVDGDWIVETEGSDILEVAQLADVDALKTTTNNIQEVCYLLGAEAAIGLMQSELHRVLSFDGSYVDPRHTWLLTDTVARSGTINPLNRHKMEELGGSLLQCASFEQTLEVFEHGAAFGKDDNLGGATEKLIVGQPVHVGTGSFAILQPEEEAVSSKVTFVAPLHSMMEEEEYGPGVMSLHTLQKQDIPLEEDIQSYKVESLFNLNKYCPPPELCSTNTMLSPLFQCMRSLAHKRIEVIIASELCAIEDPPEMSELEYTDMEESLEEYLGWTLRTKKYQQFTDVEFVVQEKHVLTRVEYAEEEIHTTHKTKHIHLSLDVPMSEPNDAWSIKATAFSWNSISVDSVPISIIPEKVSIVQEKWFIKGHWKFILSRTWSGTNIIETENQQRHKSTCKYALRVESNNVWELMEMKGSTDASMAGGMMAQILSCVKQIKSN